VAWLLADQSLYRFACIATHTLGLGPEVWRVLDQRHSVRNLGEHEGDLDIDERLVAGLITACRSVATKLDLLTPIPAPIRP
jgi:hypothetical protein